MLPQDTARPHDSDIANPIPVRPLGSELKSAITTTLLKTNELELIRLVVAAGERLPPHRAAAVVTLQCLEGQVVVCCEDKSYQVPAGTLVCLVGNQEHAIEGVEDASLLLTVFGSCAKPAEDLIDEASKESFPASDPPSRTPIIHAARRAYHPRG